MSISAAPLYFAGNALGEHRHVCAFFNSPDEEYRVMMPFIREGFARGERALHVVDPRQRADHRARLQRGGVDVDRAEHDRQLDVLSWEQAHLHGGRFDQSEMLKLLDDVLAEGKSLGYPLTRLVSHMEWALEECPGVDGLIDYEARFNDVSVRHPEPVICVYDIRRFSAGVALDVLRTHPLVVLGGILQTTPFYMPPDEFLRDVRARGSTGAIPRAVQA